MDPLTLFVIVIVLSAVTSLAFAPKAVKPKGTNQERATPAGIGDFSFPTAQEGRAIPIVFGTRFVEGSNVTWYANLSSKEIKKKVN